MAKINREEYEVLKGLDVKWKWIARDKNESLFAYSEKPPKDNHSRDWGFTGDEWHLIGEILFHFIQWEDEEPHNIQELIEEYEKYKKASDYFKVNIENVNQSMLDGLPKESEEIEIKKDIEWAISEICQRVEDVEEREETTPFNEGVARGLEISLFLINELDEPEVEQLYKKIRSLDSFNGFLMRSNNQLRDELDNQEVLSQEWIDEHKKGMFMDNKGRKKNFVWVDDLQGLFVPKQEEVDRAYKDGYEEGKQHGFYKGYREGLANKGGEPETVADVVTTFWKSYERLKEVMSMEVKELEE